MEWRIRVKAERVPLNPESIFAGRALSKENEFDQVKQAG